MAKVKIEKWKSGRMIVARNDKGKLLTWRKLKKGYTLTRAKDEFKRNRAFTDKFKREEEELTNVLERRDYVQTKISVGVNGKVSIKRGSVALRARAGDWTSSDSRKRKTVQYFVRGTLRNGTQIVGRSPALGNPLAKTPREAIDRAWTAFYAQFSFAQGSRYDADDGRNIMVENGNKVIASIDEGWVSYRRNR